MTLKRLFDTDTNTHQQGRKSKKMAEQTHIFYMDMTCEGCSNAAKRVLGKLGVDEGNITIDLEKKLITVKSSESADKLTETLKKTGKEIRYEGTN
ncbi:copper transport protein ATOX1-like [Argopecten irradians]|uniref:copper transport protein ATOX1-like n=1 Tax=Argopecten irradians TaxID=31199 RepID=UPI00371E65BC